MCTHIHTFLYLCQISGSFVFSRTLSYCFNLFITCVYSLSYNVVNIIFIKCYVFFVVTCIIKENTGTCFTGSTVCKSALFCIIISILMTMLMDYSVTSVAMVMDYSVQTVAMVMGSRLFHLWRTVH